MRIAAWLLVGMALSPAWAGKKNAQPPPPEPVRAPKAAMPLQHPLPLDVGPMPDGLANLSAQGCHACHVGPVTSWQSSAHAGGITDALRTAAAAAGDPACLSCHLPLQQQHATRADGSHNAAWSATLQSEGVTCVACHLENGVLVGATPSAAPHTAGANPAMSESTLCASCHQLTWPGASTPMYDTYGEWLASGWSSAGVTCQACHMPPSAQGGSDHAFTASLERAVSILIQPGAATLVRGDDSLPITLTLQNTGAGHHVPSGSPHTALQLQLQLVHPDADPIVVLTTALEQVFDDAPPWTISEDTRIPAGGEQSYALQAGIPQSEPAGTWQIEVSLTRTTAGVAQSHASVVRRVPLVVE